MNNAIVEIKKWAGNLVFWEQVALEKVISGKPLEDADYDELLQILLEDSALTNDRTSRSKLNILDSLNETSEEKSKKLLLRIENLVNINALVPNQTLTFSENLTAIYGGNGSGKSGYARVLANAGFSRGDREVLPNITVPVDPAKKLIADIVLLENDSEKKINYILGTACSELQSFYVFDTTSVRVHMNDASQLSFSPAGLSYLTELASVTDEVRVRLNDLIDKYNQPPSFINLFQGDTIVSKTIGELSEDSNIDEIKKLGQLSSEEKKRLSEINLTLANAELDKFHAKIEDLRDKLNVLSIFKNQLIQAENSLNRTSLNDINASIQIYHNRMSAAKDISSADFKSEVLKHAGTDVWHQFVVSAKKLADVESEQEAVYPQDGDRCLLCQQPLSSDAHNLILRLWKYLESEAQDLVNDALDDLNNKKQILDNLALFDLSFDFSTPYKYVGDYDKRLAQLIINYVTELRERRNKFAASLLSRNKIDVSDLISSFETEIESIIRNIEDELQRLKSVNLDEEILKLTSERLLLEHREILEQILPQVVSYIERLQWIEKAKKAGGNTARITKFHNQLFSSLVTDRYIELFEQNLKSLGRPLKVKVQTKGKKGDTLKQIILVADETAKNIAKPEKVLSEGEKRAVALADFLTEVELDTSSDGIILDDPVTSLDLDWREAIAKVLVSQAEHRQVIVFTHDLPFLHYLMEFSDGKSIKTFTHWVKRGDIDDMPGYTYINNSPALEKSYKKASIAKEWFEKAKSASAEDQEKYLKEGFGALRTSYEAFIVFDMFNEVVMRFNERISFGRLEGIVWSDEISEFVIKKCETLSRYIEGHLHSDAFAAKKPTLDLLKQEINDFENIQRQLKELKKNK